MPNSARHLQKIFGECVKHQRQQAKLSQEQLAELADISATYAGEIERGEKMPSLQIIVRLGSAFGITGSELLSKAHL